MDNVQIGREMKVVMNLVKRLAHADAKARGIEIGDDCSSKKNRQATMIHGMFINYIYDNSINGDVYQKDIEKEFSLRRSTATEILKLMEKNGLIIKKSVPTDARLKKLVLTDKALDEHARAMEGIKAMEKKITNGIPEDELCAFYKTLLKIKENLTQE